MPRRGKFSKLLLSTKVVCLGRCLRISIFVVSLVTLSAIIVDYGFELDAFECYVRDKVYNIAWWLYLVAYLFRVAIHWTSINGKTALMTSLLGLLFILTSLPRFSLETSTVEWLSVLTMLCSHKYFQIAFLGLYSILEASKGIVSIINKRTNPALLLAMGFLIIILVGSLLLLLPRSTVDGVRLSVVDGLFISTSAVCVTGLSPVDIASIFTTEGQIVITCLIQIGGLGVMTITSFFALFFMGNTGLYSQFALRDVVGSETFSSLISTLLYIIGFTFVIETFGAFGIWISIRGSLGMELYEEVFFAVFHSVSAFCNAGFSTLTGNLGNPIIINNHNAFYLIISAMIVLGGVGFPLLVNLWYGLKRWILGKMSSSPKYIHLMNVNTKIVLVASGILIVAGTLVMALCEWNGAFAGMTVAEKLTHSFFNSVSPRTAGFNSIDLAEFSIVAIVIYMLLMWIGGASQSTAGGIKVNTLAVVFANFVASVRGKERIELFNREISESSVKRAFAMIWGSIMTIVLFFVILLIVEPTLPAKALLFETISAFSTVGSSLGVTPLLSTGGKILIVALMFIGRVGLITFLMSFIGRGDSAKYRLPQENIIIN